MQHPKIPLPPTVTPEQISMSSKSCLKLQSHSGSEYWKVKHLRRRMYVGLQKKILFQGVCCLYHALLKRVLQPLQVSSQDTNRIQNRNFCFSPTKEILQGKNKNKGLGSSVDYGKDYILRADEQLWNTVTKNMQGRNLVIVRPRLQKPIITAVCICVSQITREDTGITLQKTVKLIIHILTQKLLNAKNGLHSSEVISLLIWSW